MTFGLQVTIGLMMPAYRDVTALSLCICFNSELQLFDSTNTTPQHRSNHDHQHSRRFHAGSPALSRRAGMSARLLARVTAFSSGPQETIRQFFERWRVYRLRETIFEIHSGLTWRGGNFKTASVGFSVKWRSVTGIDHGILIDIGSHCRGHLFPAVPQFDLVSTEVLRETTNHVPGNARFSAAHIKYLDPAAGNTGRTPRGGARPASAPPRRNP